MAVSSPTVGVRAEAVRASSAVEGQAVNVLGPAEVRRRTGCDAYVAVDQSARFGRREQHSRVSAQQAAGGAQVLEREGKWEALRAEMVAFFDEHHDDGVEYLLVTGTKRG